MSACVSLLYCVTVSGMHGLGGMDAEVAPRLRCCALPLPRTPAAVLCLLHGRMKCVAWQNEMCGILVAYWGGILVAAQ
jgi:hypothetical protein